MLRPSLPQNYVHKASVLLDTIWTTMIANFEAVNCVATLDTVNVKNSTASLKLSPDSEHDTAYVYAFDLSPATRLMPWQDMWFYVHGDPSTIKTVQLYYSSEADFSKDVYVSQRYIGDLPGQYQMLFVGWNCLHAPGGGWANDGNDTFSNSMKSIILKIEYEVASAGNSPVSFEMPLVNGEFVPRCMVTFDDASDSIYSKGYAYMQPRGIPGTFFVNSSRVDVGSYVTTAHLKEMYDDGWAISNHTYSHNETPATQEVADSEVILCRDWLRANGFTRSSEFASYVAGNHGSLYATAMENAGVVAARCSELKAGTRTYNVEHDLMLIPLTVSVVSGTTFDKIRNQINFAIANHSNVVIVCHDIKDVATDYYTPTGVFQAMIDYLYQIRPALKCVSIDEFVYGLVNPRYRSLPVGRT